MIPCMFCDEAIPDGWYQEHIYNECEGKDSPKQGRLRDGIKGDVAF